MGGSRARTLILAGMSIIIGLVIAIAMAEGTLRILGVHFPRTSMRDDSTGYAYRPNVKWVYEDEGFAHVTTNKYGFRDDEWKLIKPKDVYRIAVLGDSYVDAIQVPTEQRFTENLESQIRECARFEGKTPEVLNFGISGHGTAQELMTLRNKVWDFSPDLVLLAFLTGNDVRNNYEPLEQNNGIPYFIFSNGRLVLDESFRKQSGHLMPWWKTLLYAGADHSHVMQLLFRLRKHLINSKEKRTQQLTDSAQQNPLGEIRLDDLIYASPQDEKWIQAWRITEALIISMREEVESHGARFRVATLSNGIQVDPRNVLRNKYQKQVNSDDLFYPDMRIKALAEQEGIKVLTLAPLLHRYAREHNVFLHGFDEANKGRGHWNKLGHQVAAQNISEWICQE